MDADLAPILVSFGIPTVDMSFLVPEVIMIDKYNLIADSQREMSFEVLDAMREEFQRKKYKNKKLAGGNSQITSMVFQNLLDLPHQTVMFGAVGTDDEAIFLEKALNSGSVIPRYDVLENTRTATTVLVIHHDLRTIAVENGAGAQYTFDKFTKLREKLCLVKGAKMALFEGFFIGYSYDVTLAMMHFCRQNGIAVVINISGAYVASNFAKKLIRCIKMCDMLVGNRTEFSALRQSLGLEVDDWQMMKTVQNMMKGSTSNGLKLNGMSASGKIVIATNNKHPIYCVYGDGQQMEYEVPMVDESLIKDTTGAGDSFLGGFLYGLSAGYELKRCIKTGCLVADMVIKQHGYEVDKHCIR